MHTLSENIVTGKLQQQELFSDNSTCTLTPVRGKKVALDFQGGNITSDAGVLLMSETERSEERRVGKECRSRWSPYH